MAKKHCQPTPKPIPEFEYKTWKSCIPSKWMVWAMGHDVTYTLIAPKSTGLHKTAWINTDTLNNYDKVLVFDTLVDARRCAEMQAVFAYSDDPWCNLLPEGIDTLEYSLVVPTFEDGGLWWERDPRASKKSGSFTVKPPSLLIKQKKPLKKSSEKNKG